MLLKPLREINPLLRPLQPLPTSPTSTTQSHYSNLTTFKISAIDVSNASVSYDNLETNQKYVLQNFNFDSQNISLNSAVPDCYELSCLIALRQMLMVRST